MLGPIASPTPLVSVPVLRHPSRRVSLIILYQPTHLDKNFTFFGSEQQVVPEQLDSATEDSASKLWLQQQH